MHPLVQKLQSHLCSSLLLTPNDRILVGYSGGADSTFLLHALHELGFQLTAGHLHHGQRQEADEEMRRCQAFCDELGVPFAAGRADVPLLSKEGRMSIEMAGRMARYDFLHRAALRLECDAIATAHTLDDHIETVLLNVTRGTGISGLAGIPAQSNIIVRPMLNITRLETRAYCDELKLWYHDDPANSDPSYSRSRIRLNVIPELKKINPNLYASVNRLAELTGSEDDYLNSIAAAALEQCEAPEDPRFTFLTQRWEIVLDREKLLHFPITLLRRCLRLSTKIMGAELDYNQTVKACEGVRSGLKGAITTEKEAVIIEWDESRVSIKKYPLIFSWQVNFGDSERVVEDVLGWELIAQPTDDTNYLREPGSLDVLIDRDQVEGQLYCCGVTPEHQFQPLGKKGPKNACELMAKAGLSATVRRIVPALCDSKGIIWIPGVAPSERVRVQDGTRSCLHLSFGPIESR